MDAKETQLRTEELEQAENKYMQRPEHPRRKAKETPVEEAILVTKTHKTTSKTSK